MTEIQIKNLIKEYEKEYIEFMEIEKLPQYKIGRASCRERV